MYIENQSPDVKGGNAPRDEVVARRSEAMEALKGKVAVSTGGSSGLGLATAVLGSDRESAGGGLFKGENLLTAQLQYNLNLL